ncbi:MAG: hypothetical protein RIB84_09505 [Sneathiellaceae bacterium]
METTRQTMARDKDKARQEADAESQDETEPQDDKEQPDESVDKVLSAGLRKLYDPILEEQVPDEMLEILKRGRKR